MVTSSFKNKMGIILSIHANSQDNEPNILLQYKMKVVKIQATSKNTQQYYTAILHTKTSNKLFIIQILFFSFQVFAHFS